MKEMRVNTHKKIVDCTVKRFLELNEIFIFKKLYVTVSVLLQLF